MTQMRTILPVRFGPTADRNRRSSRKRNAKLTYSKTVNAYAGICRGRWSRRPPVAPGRWSTARDCRQAGEHRVAVPQGELRQGA